MDEDVLELIDRVASMYPVRQDQVFLTGHSSGGMGTWHDLSLHETSHYVAPLLAWNLPSGTTLKLSAAFGVTGNSHRTLIRIGVSHEISRFDRRVKDWFR